MTWHHADTDVLVEHAQQGERGALEELLQRHRPRLYRLIRCRLDPRVQARVDESDVVQETLILASRDLAHYRPQTDVPFYAWLRQIAWRQLLRVSEQQMHTIQRSVLKERPLGWDQSRWSLTQQLITASTPTKAAMDKELEQRVCDALDELSERDREVPRRPHQAVESRYGQRNPLVLRGRCTCAIATNKGWCSRVSIPPGRIRGTSHVGRSLPN